MRILFLSTWFPYPPDNGSKLRVYHLLRALGSRHEVTLLSFAFGTARSDCATAVDAFCRDVQVVAVDPFAVNQASALATFLSARPMESRRIAAMSQLVAAELQCRSYDVVIASTDMMACYALAPRSRSVKILEEHNSMVGWTRAHYQGADRLSQRVRSWASWQKRRWYESREYRHFDLITMVSEADRAATMATVGQHRVRVEVVPNGVDCAHNRPGLATCQPNVLVFNGALTYSINFDAIQYFLREVFPLVKQRCPEVRLTVTGSLKDVDTDALLLDSSVTLTDFVEDVRVPVSQAAICVVPLRDGSGTRLKVLEAMALGTPVVATPKGAEGLDVVDGKHLLLAGDPESFARCILRLLDDPSLRMRLAANARRLVEQHYDWEPIGGRFVDLVEEEVNDRRRDTA